MHLNEIINWIDGACGNPAPRFEGLESEHLQHLVASEGYQRFLQDQVNRQIIRDYLANAVLLGIISEGGLPAFAQQLATEEGRSALALHMLMSSIDEAMDLPLPTREVQVLKPLKPKAAEAGDRSHIKLVPN